MPDRLLPRKRRRLASTLIYEHPFEIALSMVLLLLGARSLILPATTPIFIAAQPDLIHYIFLVIAIGGGALTLAGIALTWRAPGIEQAGLYLSSAAWISYMVGLTEQIGTARGGLLLAAIFALAVACVVRARALNREEIARLVAVVHTRKLMEKNGGSGE